MLSKMFSGKHGDVYHMVLFTGRASEKLAAVLNAKNSILRLQEHLQKHDPLAIPSQVWFGSRIAVTVHDALGAGEIGVGNAAEMPYVLMMKFSSEEALKRYYEDNAHSDARRALNPDTKPLYAMIDKHADDVKKAAWDVINRIAKDWLKRRDYVDNETEFLVRRPIPPFKL